MNRWQIRSRRGQGLVELALVLPLFLMVLFGIVALGIGVFYQQQVTNAAREAARFASIHSATAQCPTTSHLDPRVGYVDPVSGRTSSGLAPQSYYPCDTPAGGWPDMTASARSLLFGINASSVQVAACWSGYVSDTQYDAPPTGLSQAQSTWAQCLIDQQDPTTNPRACNPLDPSDTNCIHCAGNLNTLTTDTASDISDANAPVPSPAPSVSPSPRIVANTVTAYACYVWSPPLAGFLLIPRQVAIQAVITEPMERQQ